MIRTYAYLILAILCSLGEARAIQADDGRALCFDFTKTILKPLNAAIPFSSVENPDTLASGPHPLGGGWASARARLAMPMARTLELLLDQSVLKNPKECDLEFTHEKRPGYLDFETVDITIHPFPLISIQWQEQWAYALLEGTREKPLKALISYQKISGTSHIRHFCGSIVLTSGGADATDIAIYEEADATRRTAEGIAQGHAGTLRTLRERVVKTKTE